jgi:ABC-type phosphate transport system substrate-binding protein
MASIIQNWPDVIRCGTGTAVGAVFFLHGATSVTGQYSTYAQIYNEEYRSINFNYDGSYLSRSGATITTDGCLGQSISQLYSSGRAFDLVSSKVQGPSATMIQNWPDAIRCGTGFAAGAVLFLHGATSVAGQSSSYAQVYNGEFRHIVFNYDGSYLSRGGATIITDDCLGQSISQLYSSGKAFNLVSSKVQGTSATMIQNWPDAIRCGTGAAAGAVFFLHGATSVAGQSSTYAQIYNAEYRHINFNYDGSYLSSGGATITTDGCLGQSISQLYSSGRAFNLVYLEPTTTPIITTPTLMATPVAQITTNAPSTTSNNLQHSFTKAGEENNNNLYIYAVGGAILIAVVAGITYCIVKALGKTTDALAIAAGAAHSVMEGATQVAERDVEGGEMINLPGHRVDMHNLVD